MTKSERRQVAATLRRWAKWCAADPVRTFDSEPSWCDLDSDTQFLALDAAQTFCERRRNWDEIDVLAGPIAATGLLLAAAAVEAGDVP